MLATAFPRATTVLLALLLTIPLVPMGGAAETNTDHLRVVNARTSAAYESIQAAIDAALAGDTITVPMSLNASNPTPWLEAVTMNKADLTLCATVAVAMCLDHTEPGRFESTTAATWATPPVAWQGQALKMVDVNSTSHYPNSNNPAAPTILQLTNVTAASFDYMVETGSCGGGSPRMQIGLNKTGEGSTKDGSVVVYTDQPCALGAWKHIDLLASHKWSAPFGGPGSTTKTAVESWLAANHPGYKIVGVNVVIDGSSSTTWLDNERFNGAVLREAIDFTCLDPTSPQCVTAVARSATVIDAAGANAATVRMTAPGGTLDGFTIRNTGLAVAGDGVRVTARNAVVKNNDIAGNPLASVAQMGIYEGASGAGGYRFDNNLIHEWSHSGIYAGGSTSLPSVISNNTITTQAVNALLVEGGPTGVALSIENNDLTRARNSNARLNTSRAVTMRDNVLGVSGSTIDLTRFGFAGVKIDARYNDWGAYTRATIEATIVSSPGATIDTSCYYNPAGDAVCPPSVDFSFSPAAPHIRAPVTFSDLTVAGGNDVESYAWTFGDAGTSTAESPSHAYLRSGSFDATLTVTDSEGYSASKTRTIVVSNVAPVLDPIADQATGEGLTLSFSAHATDADGDSVTYGLVAPPPGASINSRTGAGKWVVGGDQQGARVLTISATDGDKVATTTMNVTVSNGDQPPVLTLPALVSMDEGATKTVTIATSDPDGDAVALGYDALPAFATLVGDQLTLAPAVGDHGSYAIVFTATANGLTATKTLSIDVNGAASFTMARLETSAKGTPNKATSLNVTLTNTGATDDTYTLLATAPPGWTTSVPAPVAVASGASVTVTIYATGPEGQASGIVTLKATSAVNKTVTRGVSWTVSLPIFATLQNDADSVGVGKAAKGNVTVTYLDGSPVANAGIRVDQTPDLSVSLKTSISGRTDANGRFAYDFSSEPRALLPGAHALDVVVTKGATAFAHGAYDVTVL